MPRKPQNPQEVSEVSPEGTAQKLPEVTITDSNESASPVTKPAPKPVTTTELPNGLTIETY